MSRDLEGLLVVSVEQAVAAPYASGRLADAGEKHYNQRGTGSERARPRSGGYAYPAARCGPMRSDSSFMLCVADRFVPVAPALQAGVDAILVGVNEALGALRAQTHDEPR